MYVTIGKKIKMLRKEKGYSQAVLAEKSNISLSFLGHIERGSRVLSVETLLNIARALDCSVDYLLGIDIPQDVSLSRALRIAADILEGYEKHISK